MKKLLIGAAALVTAAAPLAATAAPYGGGHQYQPAATQNHWDGDRGHGGGGDRDHDWGRDHRWGGGYGWNRGYGYGYRGYGYGYGYGYRGAAVAGLFGLALGATLASERPYYYAPCYWVTRPVVGPWGGVHYRQVEVCR